MKLKLESILRQHYQPLQPTVQPSDQAVVYQEWAPDGRLRDYVYCYWRLRISRPLQQPFVYRVVADGCVDVFVDCLRPTDSFVMGFCQQYTEFPLANSFHYLGIRFFPSMFPQLFSVDAKALSNRFERLDYVDPPAAVWLHRLLEEESSPQKVTAGLNTFLFDKLANAHLEFDPRVYCAFDLILRSHGAINTDHLDTGVSPRQLRRLFNNYLGTTPKTFSKVVRFQRVLRAIPSAQSQQQSKAFYDAGYYDQAHFIKDFKHFYGVTPTRAFR
ncbi:MAG: helix-turn-helix domain-containing protein [Tunicatimonas sp.]